MLIEFTFFKSSFLDNGEVTVKAHPVSVKLSQIPNKPGLS